MSGGNATGCAAARPGCASGSDPESRRPGGAAPASAECAESIDPAKGSPPLHERPCPAPRAGDAREWFEVAQQDIKVMRQCHKNGDYGAAAYHCQQALEKIVKFAVVKYDLLDNPADLNHEVILGLLLEWRKDAPMPEHPWARSALELACKLLRAFGKSSRGASERGETARDGGGPSPKDALWSASLGREVASPKLDEMWGKMQHPPERLLRNALEPHLPKKDVNDMLECMRESTKKEDEDSAIIAVYAKLAVPLWKKFQRDHKPRAGRKRLDQAAAKKCLLLWLLANIDTLLKAAPHAEYGRYPGTLCENSRAQWYAENSGSLLEMEESASKAFWELYRMIKC